MPTLHMGSPMALYLLGDLPPDESQRIEEAMLFNHTLRREFEAAEEELTAAYVSGQITTDTRERFERYFLRSEERVERLRLAELLYKYSRADAPRFPDTSNPLHRYFLDELAPDEKLKIEERLRADIDYKNQSEDARRELIAAHVLKQLAEARRERFEEYFLNSEERLMELKFAKAAHAHL